MPEIPVTSDIRIGTGIDSATSKSYRAALDFDEPTAITTGQDVVAELLSIESSRELAQNLNIDASAAFKKGLGGASAEFSLSQNFEFNQYFTYALIRVSVRNSPVLLNKPRLSKEAEDFVTKADNGLEDFFNQYGDQFVEGIVTGGSYYALIQIQTTNQTEQNDVRLVLSAYYGSFNASADFKRDFQEIQSKTITNIYLRQSGGSGDSIELTLDEMIEQTKSFPNLIKDAPVAVVAITANYRDKVLFPSIPSPGSLPRIQQKNVLEDLGREYFKLRDYKANIQFILENFVDFDDFRELDTATLSSRRQEYQDSLELVLNEIDEIVDRAESCQNDFGKCETYAPNIDFLPLPTIGGEQLSIKQMEEQLAVLRQQVANLTAETIRAQNTADDAVNRANKAQNTADDAVNRANKAQNAANDAVNRANKAQNTANDAVNRANDANVFGQSVVIKVGGDHLARGNRLSSGRSASSDSAAVFQPSPSSVIIERR